MCYYYTSPEISLYKSNTLDWYLIQRDKMKNITCGYANEGQGLPTLVQFVWIKHLRHIQAGSTGPWSRSMNSPKQTRRSVNAIRFHEPPAETNAPWIYSCAVLPTEGESRRQEIQSNERVIWHSNWYVHGFPLSTQNTSMYNYVMNIYFSSKPC